MASTSFSKPYRCQPALVPTGHDARSAALHQITPAGESAVHSIPDQDAVPPFVTQIGATFRRVESIKNSAELARRLGVPESWVRSRSNPK